MFDFHVIDGTVVRDILADTRGQVTDEVRSAYLGHHRSDFRNPPSGFLRFPGRPDCRIIALPAHLGDGYDIAGLKWVASFPSNVAANVPRASAVLLLNDATTGYPFACLEAAQISSARTAASAVVAAEALHDEVRHGRRTAGKVAVVGAGVIARAVIDFLAARAWSVDRLDIYDRHEEYAALLAGHATTAHGHFATVAGSLGEAVRGADIVIFATTATEPHVTNPRMFAPGQLVLNISLRDLAPEIIAEADNVVDAVEHCLTANTSPHLAEQKYGHRDFVTGTLAQILLGQAWPSGGRPVIFSPFGLGVLDLMVGWHVFRIAVDTGCTHPIPGFFGQTERWETHGHLAGGLGRRDVKDPLRQADQGRDTGDGDDQHVE